MFRDARARLKWRMFVLRARLVLDPLPRDAREELIADLTAHAKEIVDHTAPAATEIEQADEVLARIGDPKEFLAPLVAEAVFRSKQNMSLGLVANALRLYGSRGIGHLIGAAATLSFGLLGALFCVAAIGSLFVPGRIGVFRMSDGDIRLPILGDVARYGHGEQLLTPFIALLLSILGVALCGLAIRAARRAALRLIAASPL